MTLTIRARLTLLYFAVLVATFIAFFWICDFGFRRSIETTVNDASERNLASVTHLLAAKAPLGTEKVKHELKELSELWENGAIFEVIQARAENGTVLFRSPEFADPDDDLPPVPASGIVFLTANLKKQQYRIALERVEIAGQSYAIRSAVPTEPFDQALDHFRLIEKEALPLLAILASILGYWLSGRSLAPVNRIIRSAEQVGVQSLSQRLEVPRAKDELRRLTLTLNAMLERIEISFKRITQFTADASHDLRTPISVIRATSEIALRRQRSEAEYREALTKILNTSTETTDLLEQLLSLARADAGAAGLQMQVLDLNSHVRKTQECAMSLAASKALRCTARTPESPVWVKADGVALDRLLLILVDNAVKYTPEGGHCHIELTRSDESAEIRVSDTGIGIAESDLDSVFERFYRADRARARGTGGAGLGLAIAKWIAEMHGGTIAAESRTGQGSTFRVRLPISAVA
jgi:heavy metal sensor kinase